MTIKPTTIAVIADVHYGTDSLLTSRRCQISDILLARTVNRFNKLIHPDVTLVLGDVIDNGNSDDAETNLRHIKSILDTLDSPYIAIPGNHDGDPKRFYQVFDRPKDIEEVCGIRFLSFIDREEQGYNASRSKRSLDLFRKGRSGYDGPLVALQHVCLFPPARQAAPYNYINASEIITAMKESGVTFSVSGHHHNGAIDTHEGDVMFINAPGLCETPFPFVEITIDNEKIQTQRHVLTMPEDLQLFDNHLHTPMAYCSKNMLVEKAINLAHDFGLAGVKFTEHSGQLYFNNEQYWSKSCLQAGMNAAREADNRMAEYLNMKQTYENDFACFDLEADCDYSGNLLISPNDRKHFNHIMGALHGLPGLTKDTQSKQEANNNFLLLVEKLLENNIKVLAHPFRIFRHNGWDPPSKLFEPTARLLRKYKAAAEINFHANEPPVEFIRKCLDLGVKFSFGSDSHNLAEIGDFAYQLVLLREAGFDGDLSDILVHNR